MMRRLGKAWEEGEAPRGAESGVSDVRGRFGVVQQAQLSESSSQDVRRRPDTASAAVVATRFRSPGAACGVNDAVFSCIALRQATGKWRLMSAFGR